MKSEILIGVGEILWDVFPDGKVLGGAPANFAYHAGRLGANGVVISRVGDDSDGCELIERLNELGIAHILEKDSEHPTGTVRVVMDDKGGHSFLIEEERAWDYLTVTPEVLRKVRTADALCYGSLAQRNPFSGRAVRDCIRAVGDQALRIFDVNLRQSYFSRALLAEMLQLSTIVKLNDEELAVLASLFGLQGAETELLGALIKKFDLDLLVLTRGGRGSRLFDGRGRDSEMETLKTTVVDTVGAGDSFTAAIAVGLLRGLDLEYVHRLATLVAAFVCSKKGATPLYTPTEAGIDGLLPDI